MRQQSSEEWNNMTLSFSRERAQWLKYSSASHSSEMVFSLTVNQEATRMPSLMRKKKKSNKLTNKLSGTLKFSMD
jgi:hypothetical protein